MIECFMLLAALAVFLLVMLAMGWNTADVVRLVRRPKREPGDPSALERQLIEAHRRLYDLEERVARLEDPYGKRKRGFGIYADPFQGVPGLKALEDYVIPDDAPAQIRGDGGIVHSYILSDDGELQAGKD